MPTDRVAERNRARLQTCIKQSAATGRTLYFPPGTYHVNGTLKVQQGGYTFRGANRETTKIVETTSSVNLFEAKTPTGGPLNHLTFSSLQLSYSTPDATGTALNCTSCWRTFLENMAFGSTRAGAHMGGTGVSVVRGNQFRIVDGCSSAGVRRAVL